MSEDSRMLYVRYGAIALEFAGTAVVGVVSGGYIDSHLGTSPWGVFLGTILCLAGGFYRLVISLQQINKHREQQNNRKN